MRLTLSQCFEQVLIWKGKNRIFIRNHIKLCMKSFIHRRSNAVFITFIYKWHLLTMQIFLEENLIKLEKERANIFIWIFLSVRLLYFRSIVTQVLTTKTHYSWWQIPGFLTRIHASLKNVKIVGEPPLWQDSNSLPLDSESVGYPWTMAYIRFHFL